VHKEGATLVKDGLGDVQSLLVLGATSDIAQAVTRKFVARKCRTVILACRHANDVAGFADELRAEGAVVDTVEFDADDTDHHATVIGGAFDRHGDIDVILFAWGVLGDQAKFDSDPALAAAAARTNYVGVVSAGLVVADRLRQQGHGTIVLLSSVAGERARKANYVYGSTKAGADAFAQGLGDAVADDGVRVLVVRPGFVATKMTAGMKAAPLSTTADAVADAVVKGVATGKETVWVPGTLRVLFTALRHLPRAVWRKVPM
jgi:decaprenylphospho-beta-D-erythro-pentofuranosid-2-ulose 2-reductase